MEVSDLIMMNVTYISNPCANCVCKVSEEEEDGNV